MRYGQTFIPKWKASLVSTLQYNHITFIIIMNIGIRHAQNRGASKLTVSGARHRPRPYTAALCYTNGKRRSAHL